MVLPISQHPTQPNGVIVVDLDTDPTDLIELDSGEIRDRVFVSRADLPEDVARIPLKTVHVNRSPALAPMSTLAGVDKARIGLDVERCLRHRERLLHTELLAQKVREVFANVVAYPKSEAEFDLYAGLPGNADLERAAQVRRAGPEQLRALGSEFNDLRYRELLFRYRARHYPDSLDVQEHQRWRDWKRNRLIENPEPPERGATALLGRVHTLRRERADDGAALRLLDQVESWIRNVQEDLQ